jgi:signal transduction histidine kinase
MMQDTVRQWQSVPLVRDSLFDTYFHTLSHDLRTPLNQISGFAELLNLDQTLAVAHKEYVAAIVSACGALHDTVLAHLHLIENSLGGEDGPGPAGDDRLSGDQPKPR